METSTLITTRASYRTKGSELTALYFGAISLVTAGAGMAERWQSAGEKAIATMTKALHIPLYFREQLPPSVGQWGLPLQGSTLLFPQLSKIP